MDASGFVEVWGAIGGLVGALGGFVGATIATAAKDHLARKRGGKQELKTAYVAFFAAASRCLTETGNIMSAASAEQPADLVEKIRVVGMEAQGRLAETKYSVLLLETDEQCRAALGSFLDDDGPAVPPLSGVDGVKAMMHELNRLVLLVQERHRKDWYV